MVQQQSQSQTFQRVSQFFDKSRLHLYRASLKTVILPLLATGLCLQTPASYAADQQELPQNLRQAAEQYIRLNVYNIHATQAKSEKTWAENFIIDEGADTASGAIRGSAKKVKTEMDVFNQTTRSHEMCSNVSVRAQTTYSKSYSEGWDIKLDKRTAYIDRVDRICHDKKTKKVRYIADLKMKK